MVRDVHIGKAAKVAGVSVDTIRFYQRLGLINSVGRSPGGCRLFDGEQIHDLTFVRYAQELGFSLTEAKSCCRCGKGSRLFRSAIHAQAQAGGCAEEDRHLSRLEAERSDASRNCNRELRGKREIKHEDCCPLSTKLHRLNDSNSN